MSDLIARFPTIRPVQDIDDVKALQAEASRDGYQLIYPTHIVEKGGEIAGGFGMNTIPLLRIWLHRERMKVRDTAVTLAVVENLLRANGVNMVAALMSPKSPLCPHMEHLGWARVGEALVCVKQLGK